MAHTGGYNTFVNRTRLPASEPYRKLAIVGDTFLLSESRQNDVTSALF